MIAPDSGLVGRRGRKRRGGAGRGGSQGKGGDDVKQRAPSQAGTSHLAPALTRRGGGLGSNALQWVWMSTPSGRHCQTRVRGSRGGSRKGGGSMPRAAGSCQYALAVQTARRCQLYARALNHPRLPRDQIWAGMPKVPGPKRRYEKSVSSYRPPGGNDCVARSRKRKNNEGGRIRNDLIQLRTQLWTAARSTMASIS